MVFVNVTCRVHSEMYTHSRVETDVRVGENLISVDCVNHPHLGNVADTFPIMLRPKAKRVFPPRCSTKVINDHHRNPNMKTEIQWATD